MDCSEYLSFSHFLGTHGFIETLLCFFQHAPISSAAAANSLWLIIALPLLGALICGVFGRTLGRENTNLIACGSVFGSFVLSLLAYWCSADWHTTTPNAYGEVIRYAVGADLGT